MKKPSFICIHHTGVSHQKNSNQFSATNNYHKALYGFVSSLGFFVGYNYELAANGKVTQARADGERTAAVKQWWTRTSFGLPARYTGPMNDGRCIHICLDGNFDIEKPKPEQIYALRDLLKAKRKQYGIPKENIYFHRNFAVKSCCGKNMDLGWIRELSNR